MKSLNEILKKQNKNKVTIKNLTYENSLAKRVLSKNDYSCLSLCSMN